MEGTEHIDILLVLFGGSFIILSIAAVLLGFFFVNQKKAHKRKIAEQLTKTAHQQELLYTSIENQERERRRIAQDLHDEIGTLLSVVRMNVSQIEWHADDAEQQRNFTSKSKELIDKVIDNTRKISHELLPASLEIFGLCKTLGNLCANIMEASGISLVFEEPETKISLAPDVELGLYRICSELINNSIKHSGCDEIALSLCMTDNELEIKYSDNGKGYNANSATAKAGMGLKNIISRVQMLGARVDFKSQAGSGTQVLLQLRLNN